ncbi:hypothetical protein ILUMI_12030 [Ignelater luminosus]|uniref:Uncharacterized protein n=1 Tax=Ignelater luminosus TaxID=2038154 RepID=A0A8K0CUX0_IGNLU|nr:hypothetical protein ILUMI_12030 [Ignelater luminosus]
MEICRCEERREAVKNIKIWTISTLHPILVKRIPVPPEVRVVMKKNQTSHDDYRYNRPYVLKTIPRTSCPEKPKKTEKISNKWIPVLPGLISEKLVNESKGLSDRPF